MSRVFAAALTFAFAVPAAAQSHAGHSPDAAVNAIRPLYQQAQGFLSRTAEMVSEADYGFKPTPEVRSLGEILGHVANSMYFFCSNAVGEKSPNAANFEKVTAKAELVKALKDAFAYCDTAYQMTDAKAMEEVTFFGQKNNRLYVLNFNALHNMEHYGNLVTYLRLKGMVPPSSQGSM
jgi:uncharacterized damage-inducible protein DinB